MTGKLIVLTISLLMLGGCVSSNAIAIGDKYPPRPVNFPIDIYVSSDAPVVMLQAAPGYLDVSRVPVSGATIGRVDTNGAADADWTAVFADAKVKARQLGGSAIVVKGASAPLVGFTYGTAVYAKQVSMTVIRY